MRAKTLVSLPVLVLAALLGLMVAAPAQSDPKALNETPCFDPQASDDDTIASCTSLVAGGSLSGNNLAATYDNRGFAYSNKRQYDLALLDFDRALSLNPRNVQALINRGLVYFQQDRYDLAIDDDNTVLLLAPNNVDAFNNRGLCYYNQGQYDLAIADFNQEVRAMPNAYLGYYNRGRANARKGQRDLAIADFSEALRIKPDFSPARTELARLAPAASPPPIPSAPSASSQKQ